jgi:hypothetical protein
MASAETLQMDLTNNKQRATSQIPRIDLAKIDNIPYFIESWLLISIVKLSVII